MMQRLALITFLVFVALPLHAQTPGFVQAADGATNSTISTDKITIYKLPLGSGSLANNLIVVFVTWGSTTATVTITDNKGNTWTAGPLVRDTTNVQSGEAFFCSGCISGTQIISATISALSNFVTMWAEEFNNIATSSALDCSHGAFTSGTSIQPGSCTTGTSGDLIVQWATCDSGCSSDLSGTFSAQSGFTLASAATLKSDINAVQYGVQSSAGAINPTITSPASIGYISIQMAFKAAAAGTAPASFRINSVGHRNTKDETAASRKFQFPCSGNLLAIASANGTGSPSRHITAVTDSNGNTWAQPTGSPFDDGGNNTVQLWYAAGATCSGSEQITLTLTGSDATGNGETYMMFDISGASSSPFDNLQTANGTQTVSGNFAGVSITPAVSNEIVLSWTSTAHNNVTGISTNAGTPFFGSTVGTCGTGWAPPTHADENNGWATMLSAPASSITWTWNQDNCQQTGVGAWANMAAAFNNSVARGINKRTKLEQLDP
jgi:hypothetical protein